MAILDLKAAGVPLVEVAATITGDEFDNTLADSIVHLYNQSGVDLSVKALEQRACPYGDSNVHTSQLATIPAGMRLEFGPFAIYRYNNTFRRVEVSYPGGVTGLWVAARRRPF